VFALTAIEASAAHGCVATQWSAAPYSRAEQEHAEAAWADVDKALGRI